MGGGAEDSEQQQGTPWAAARWSALSAAAWGRIGSDRTHAGYWGRVGQRCGKWYEAAELRAGRTHTARWEGVQGSPTVLGLGRVSKVARYAEVTLACCSPAHAIPVCRGMKLPSLNFEETSTWHSGVHVVCPLAHTIPVCRGMKLPSVNSEETSTR